MADERLRSIVQRYGGQQVVGMRVSAQTLQGRTRPTSPSQPQRKSEGIFDKVSTVLGSTARLGAQGLIAAGKFIGNTALDIGESAIDAGKFAVNAQVSGMQVGIGNKLSTDIDAKERELLTSYRQGKVSKQDYNDRIKVLADARREVNDKFIKPVVNYDIKEGVEAVAETTVNAMTLGRWSTVKAVGAQTAKETAKRTLLDKSVVKAVTQIEKTLLKIPSAKELVTRNMAALAKREAQRLAGETVEQYMVREGRRVAVGLLIKRPIFYQQNVDDAQNVYQGMMDGDFGTAAKSMGWMSLQMIGGGPVGWFMDTGKKAGVKLRDISYGRGSLIDKLSSQIGNNNPAQIGRYLNKIKDKAPQEYENATQIFRIMQETNLRVAGENVDEAVDNILRNYDLAGMSRTNITPDMFVRDYGNWHEAAKIVDGLKGLPMKGLDPDQVNNLVVIRWDSVMKRGLSSAIEEAGDNRQAMAAVLEDFSQRTTNGWGNNPVLMKQITKILDEAETAKDAARRIKAIPTATAIPESIPHVTRKKLAKLGYAVAVPMKGVRNTPMVKLDDTRKLVTAAIKGDKEVFDIATEPVPAMQAIAGALDAIGLSPQGKNEIANKALRQSLVANVSELDVAGSFRMVGDGAEEGGGAIISQLQRYIEAKKPAMGLGSISAGKSAVTDVRMLRVDEIQEALGIAKAEAKQIQKAVIDAYTKVPLELRGLGDRVVDYAFKFNPAQKHYARIQSALRYTYNPFFRFQEQVETAAIAKMDANKFMWLKGKDELDDGVRKLTETGFFEGNLMSAAADDQVFGRISANLTQFQKRNLSGLALTIAERKGLTLDEMVKQYPDELDDALRVIVQYPKKGSISSPLARTINVAFFPMRYNAKVSMMAAQKIGELPPSVQLATIQGFMKMKDWLKSDEGIRWQSEHADAIQIFRWATPVGSIQSFYKIMTGNVEAPADMGLLGGLPFGVISQILDSQGIINLNTPYVNPKTGDEFPDYIPQTTKARAAVALNDLLGTMFSFPGRTLGLPGKEATLRKMVDAFIDTKGADFDKRYDTDNLTPLQKNMIKVLKGDTSEEAVDALYKSAAPGQFDYYTIPTFDLPERKTPSNLGEQGKALVAEAEAKRKSKRKGRTKASERVAGPIERPE